VLQLEALELGRPCAKPGYHQGQAVAESLTWLPWSLREGDSTAAGALILLSSTQNLVTILMVYLFLWGCWRQRGYNEETAG
jgi:hypothetical protein